VGDYDNDGYADLLVTAYGKCTLYHNNGNGTFADITQRAGVGDARWSTGCAFGDYNRDGFVDLYVANYVQFDAKTIAKRGASSNCQYVGFDVFCGPRGLTPEMNVLYRNNGNGTFTDVTEAARVRQPGAFSFGVLFSDLDDDGWPDLFVANDTQPNKLYRNTGKGSFVESGMAAGVAYGEDGVARGAMGADAGDYDGSGRPHLLVGNFSNQMLGLYHNEGNGLFVDESPSSAVGRASLLSLTFGTFFFDYDLDGFLDIFAANGHVADDISVVQPTLRYAQPPILFRNLLLMHFDGSDRQFVMALDKSTGKTVWQTKRSIDFQDLDKNGKPAADGDLRKAFSTPHVERINGRWEMISLGAKAAYSYDPFTGRELWRVEERGQHSASTRPVVGHGMIFFPTGFSAGQLFAVARAAKE
jgi:hypothetical protein